MITFKMFLENADQRRLDVFKKDKYLDKAHQSLSKSVDRKDISHKDTKAIKHYTGNSYRINKEIKSAYNSNKPFGEVLSTINDRTRLHLDHAISKSKPLTSQTHVYHGTKKDPRKEIENGVYHNKTYISTSLSPTVAHDFSSLLGKDGHIIHFHLPKGSRHGLYADALDRTQHGDNNFYGYDKEHEYILKHGQKWKHLGSEKLKINNFNVTLHHMIPHSED